MGIAKLKLKVSFVKNLLEFQILVDDQTVDFMGFSKYCYAENCNGKENEIQRQEKVYFLNRFSPFYNSHPLQIPLRILQFALTYLDVAICTHSNVLLRTSEADVEARCTG